MPRVLLLATTTGYQTRAFGEAAERLGVQLVFATDRCHMLEDPWQDGAIAIRFHHEDASVEAIVLAAACPTGVNAYVVASRFRTGEALSSNAITLTTALAVLTVALWLHVLAGI